MRASADDCKLICSELLHFAAVASQETAAGGAPARLFSNTRARRRFGLLDQRKIALFKFAQGEFRDGL